MLITGSKVIVIESSLKKVIGPRVGSMGYVIESTSFNISSGNDIIYHACDILFTRYGFEENKRHEVKRVTNVLPFPHYSTSQNYARELIKKAKKVVSSKNKNKSMFNGSEYTSADVIAIPILNHKTNLLKCEFEEFHAWLDSYLRSPLFIEVLTKLMEKNFVGNSFPLQINPTLVEFFMNCISKRAYKNVFLKQNTSNRDFVNEKNTIIKREDIITAIKILQSNWMRSYLENLMVEIENQTNLLTILRDYVLPNIHIDDVLKLKTDVPNTMFNNTLKATNQVLAELTTIADNMANKEK